MHNANAAWIVANSEATQSLSTGHVCITSDAPAIQEIVYEIYHLAGFPRVGLRE